MRAYLCVVAKELSLESNYAADGNVGTEWGCKTILATLASTGTSSSSSVSSSLCGAPKDNSKHKVDVSSYACMLKSAAADATKCLGYRDYLLPAYQSYSNGCGTGAELCCPTT